MSVVNVSGLAKYYGPDLIFSGVGFQVVRGEKVALVGVNGAGKSTLLKIIAGAEELSGGSVSIARGARVAYLAQEAQFSGERTLWQEMEASLDYLIALREEMEQLEAVLADTDAPEWEARMEHYGELQHRFEHGGGYEIEHRIDRTLHGLGFTEQQHHQLLAQFSGGQKTRAALAAALLSDPDLLLLDEPTNHLDLAALEWLERFLSDWDGTLIVISHDRYFLDRVTRRTLDMAFGRLEDYPGGYNKYLQLKAERLELLMKQFQAQQDYVTKTEEFIRRFKAGQRSKEARGREKRLDRLKEGWQDGSGRIHKLMDRPEAQHKKLAFNMATQVRSGELVLGLQGLVVGYVAATKDEGRTTNDPSQHASSSVIRPSSKKQRVEHILLKCPDLEIGRGQRVALMGPNGSGKTTLLRTLVGDLPQLGGRVRLGHNVTVNYYAQAHEGLRMDATVLDEIRRIAPRMEEMRVRTLLGRFLFSGDDVFKRVGDLSGGERSRVALAQLMLMSGNLLVLDEPTNHLDIDAREALEGVLNEYNGSILFVSHDRYFVDAVADTIWMVHDGTIEAFGGTWSEYQANKEQSTQNKPNKEQRTARQPNVSAVKENGVATAGVGVEQKHTTLPSQPTKPINREAERETRRRQRRLAALEEEIAQLEAEIKQIEAEMNGASTRGDVGKVTSLGMQHADVSDMVSSRMEEWTKLAG